MKISTDQNTIETDGKVYEFVEATYDSGFSCNNCAFGEINCFNKVPCSPAYRHDELDGYFKKVANEPQ